MADEGRREPSIFSSYRVQDRLYGRHVFRPWRLAVACVSLAFAALFGWFVFLIVPGWPRELIMPPYPLVPSIVILILVFLAAFRNEPGWVYPAAILGLVLLGFPTLATLLCILALVMILRVETSEPLAGNL